MAGRSEAIITPDYVLESDFCMNGQALGFPINFEGVLRHLRQDMRDDWYFDCLQYDDLFKSPVETNSTANARRIAVRAFQSRCAAFGR